MFLKLPKADQTNLPKTHYISLSKACTHTLYIFSDNVCILYIYVIKFVNDIRGHHGCDRMVAVLITTCAISTYLSCQFELLSWRDVLIQHYVIKFEKTTNLSKVTDKLGQTSSHNVVSSTPRHQRDSNSQRL